MNDCWANLQIHLSWQCGETPINIAPLWGWLILSKKPFEKWLPVRWGAIARRFANTSPEGSNHLAMVRSNHVLERSTSMSPIKRGTPQLNGKVERSHRSDQQEFCQLLSYKGDVALEAKLSE